jgi:hypothetical protein
MVIFVKEEIAMFMVLFVGAMVVVSILAVGMATMDLLMKETILVVVEVS